MKICTLFALLLLGCEQRHPSITVDECLRQKLFRECMELSKPGQVSAAKACGQLAYTHSHNDWASVKTECSWEKRVWETDR